MERENQIAKKDFFMTELPDLSKAKAAPLELTGEYWTPEKEGEVRRVFFNEIRQELAIEPASGKDIELSVAYFVEVKDGDKKVVRQASKRLTGALETLKIPTGTPLEITYLGKKKNKTNSFMSDNWSIKPLYIESGEAKCENANRTETNFATQTNRREPQSDMNTITMQAAEAAIEARIKAEVEARMRAMSNSGNTAGAPKTNPSRQSSLL